jgi:hypothetical protein
LERENEKGRTKVLRKTFSYAVQLVVFPGRTVGRISADSGGLWAGLWLSLFFLGAYSLTVLIYWLLGHQPMNEGWLTVPSHRWYLVQSFTTIPVGLAGFLSYGGLAYLLCRAAGGTGSFEATFATQTYCLILPCVVFMLLLELLVAPFMIASGVTRLPWPQWVESLRVFVLPFAWIFSLSAFSLHRVHGIHWLAGLGISVVSMIPLAVIMAVFIR